MCQHMCWFWFHMRCDQLREQLHTSLNIMDVKLQGASVTWSICYQVGLVTTHYMPASPCLFVCSLHVAVRGCQSGTGLVGLVSCFCFFLLWFFCFVFCCV